ncbi:copper amine oxidase [Zopfochytrium polystomum]|nr:copper amine oxidase [Zopfochytrium polystomum]
MPSLKSILVAVVAASATLSRVDGRPSSPFQKSSALARRSESSVATCADPVAVTTTAPYKNVWTDLSKEESDGVIGFLFASALGFNLTAYENATLSDNYIHSIDLLRPSKADALAYYSGSSATPPTRYAKVIINHFGLKDPVFKMYKVGPVPVTNKTTITPLTEIYKADPTRSINCGPWDDPLSTAQDVVVAKVMTSIADITEDLLGYSYYGADDERSTLSYETTAPLGRDGKDRYGWSFFLVPGQAYTIMPVGLQVAFDFAGNDPNKFSFKVLWYNGQTWTSLDAFRSDWKNGKIVRGAKVSNDTAWTSTGKQGGPTPSLDSKKGPVGVSPSGARYSVDTTNRFVSWNDWTFYIATDGPRGVALFNIEYSGERIVYEIGLQEAIAQYAGNNPAQLSTVYLDSYYGFGRLLFQLVEGYDVPYGATFLESWTNYDGKTYIHPNSIAIFEMDTARPISRHLDGWYGNYNKVASTKDPVLVVRSIATIGNYDYIIDYMFHFDGTIEYQISASGYLQASYYTDAEADKGFRIHDVLHGSMHDHVMHIKVDLDVAGDTANSLEKIDIVQMDANIPESWFPSSRRVGTTPNTMGIKRSYIPTESALSWPDNGQGMFIASNKNKKNKWGEPRGYRIAANGVTQTITSKSQWLTNGAKWAKMDLAVTVRKDSEPYSSDEFNQESNNKPLVNFEDFFDGESVDGADIVAWVTLGMHHVPNTQDIPNTLAHTAHTSLILTPFNYFDFEQTRRSDQIIEIDSVEGVINQTEWSPLPTCFVNLTSYEVTDPYTGFEEYHNVLVKGPHKG